MNFLSIALRRLERLIILVFPEGPSQNSNYEGNFWYFWLTIQNTADRQVRNLFFLLAVFILFPLARAAAAVAAAGFGAAAARPDPTPPPFVGGGKYPKKENRL